MTNITRAEQILLNEEEYNNALDLIDKAKFSINNRIEYCKNNNLDIKTQSPGGQWTRERAPHIWPFLDKLLDKQRNTLNNLRLYCYPFVGYCRYHDKYNKTYDDFNQMVSIYEMNDDIFDVTQEDDISLDECKLILSNNDLLNILYLVPIRFGEFGQYYHDKIINHDVKCCLEKLAYMYEGRIFDFLKEIEKNRKPVILEIGGGYGGLAYQIMTNFKNAQYTILDMPESLVFSSIYLSTVLPQSDIHFINNYEIDKLNSLQHIDLIINTLSMSEMLESQIRFYCKKLQPLLNNGGYFFDLNEDRRQAGSCNAVDIIIDYFKLKKTLSGKYIPYNPRHNCTARIWISK